MRLMLVTVLAVTFVVPPASAGVRWQPMNLISAKYASRLTAEDIAIPFGETRPRIAVRCSLTTRTRADCHVRIRAQRLRATFETAVRWREDQGYAFARHLRVITRR